MSNITPFSYTLYFYILTIFSHLKFYKLCVSVTGLPSWLRGNEATCHAGDAGSISGSGSFPGEGNGNPLHYCCLGNPMDRGAWQATVHGISESLM